MADNDKRPTTEPVVYETLSPQDQLGIAKDALRGRESDHYRLSVMSDAAEPTRNARLPVLAAEVKRLQATVRQLEASLKGGT